MINPRDSYNNNNNNTTKQQGHPWHTHQQHHQHQLWHQQQQHQNDMSIYSPSLVYHIYDQINPLPNESTQHQQQQPQHHFQQLNIQHQQQQHQPYTYGRTLNPHNPNNHHLNQHYNFLSQTLNLSGSQGSSSNGSNSSGNNHHHHLHNHLHHLNLNTAASSLCRNGSSCNTSKTYAHQTTSNRFKRRARQFFYQYRTIVEYSIALILIALTLFTIIKFTLLSSSQHNSQFNPSSSYAKASSLPPLPSRTFEDEFTSYPADTIQQPSSNKIPPPDVDTLKSKLIIGEFVILSQNYSHIESQKAPLADRIVKLMDQWILASEFRPNYSRMEVTGIRPHQPSGIVVSCTIILKESIGFAAPLFGNALYNSLVKNHDRLANVQNYIIDKNSIKFSTVPDDDIRLGIVPSGLLPASVRGELASSQSVGGGKGSHFGGPLAAAGQQQQQLQELGASTAIYDPRPPEVEGIPPGQASLGTGLLVEPKTLLANEDKIGKLVVWSAWSPWSSCDDKNGICDYGRIHSRIRTCVHQISGEKVDVKECKQRFNMMDQELESEPCARTCQQPSGGGSDLRIQSDAPSASIFSSGPQTAPSVMVDSYIASTMSNVNLPIGQIGPREPIAGASVLGNNPHKDSGDIFTPASISASSSSTSSSSGNPNQDSSIRASTSDIMLEKNQPILLDNNNQQMSCSNCTTDEICLLLISQKVPFCAKMKDRSDETGCGGWCKGSNQICQTVGQNAFKCVHDNECLPDEWRCHDNVCIPLTKRCDGHFNCYDNSDERDCPVGLVRE